MKRIIVFLLFMMCCSVYAGDITRNDTLPDSANKSDFYDLIDTATISNNKITEAMLKANNDPTDGYFLQYDTTNDLQWAQADGRTYILEFQNADLINNCLSVGHSLSVNYPSVTIYDNSENQILPDEVEYIDDDTISVSLTSYGTLSGDWNAKVVG